MALVIAAAAGVSNAHAAELVAIVNASRPETNLSLDQITKIFRGDIHYWPNRQRIAIIIPPSHSQELLSTFVKSRLNVDPERFEMYWEEKRFRGEVPLVPQRAQDEEAAIKQVETSTNTLALLEREYLSRVHRSSVKVLSIDGKLPGEAGYPLAFGR